MPAQKKIEQVKNLTDKLKKVKSVVLVDYQGLSHQQLVDLRGRLKGTGSTLAITKNTFLKLALEKANYQPLITNYPLAGPTASLFIPDDPLPTLQILARFTKEFDLPKIKIGILKGELLAEKEVLRLATLPSKEVLTAQVIRGLKAPPQRLILALAWNLRRLKTALEKIKEQKEN